MKFSWLNLLLLFCTYLYAESQEVFLSEPSSTPYYVHEGTEAVTLPCIIDPKYFNQNKYEINWAQYNNGHLRMITKNDKLLVKKNSRFGLNYDPATGNYSLKIAEIEKNSVEGTYHCNVIATDDVDEQYSRLATVVVLVPPGDPIIDITSPESVIEGDFVTAKCVSVGGSPHPTFSWELPNGTLASSSLFTTTFRDGATQSMLHFRVFASDHGKTVRCSVRNQAMNELDTKDVESVKLNIIYKPIVSVGPTENLTHLSVEEGSLVNLTCSSLSNPPVHSYEWKHLQSGERYQGKVWPLEVDTKMNGDYECRATNEIGENSAVLKLVVQFTPKITVPESVNPSESEDVIVKCEVDSVPPAIDIKWIGPHGFRQNGSHLNIKNINSAQTGNYTCMATNFLTIYGQSGSQQRTGTGMTVVNVKRKPGIAQILDGKRNVDLGKTIQLKCYSEDAGNPEAMYTWASPSSGGIFGLDGHMGDTFVLRNAQLSDNGNYSCKAFNDLGEGLPSTVQITVIEKAQISNPLPTERIFSLGEQDKMLECEAQGYPAPVITWLKNGKPLKSNTYSVSTNTKTQCQAEDFCTQTVTSTLSLAKTLNWFDKGNFTCVADNGSESSDDDDAASWTVVKILHKPVILNRRFQSKSLAAADVGSQAILKCIVSARPEPKFHWIFKSSEVEENEKYSMHTFDTARNPDEYEQQLQIENVQESDYGEYVCQSTNGNGGDNILIELRKTSVPEVPVDFRKISASSKSILLMWSPNFDGGFKQNYIIQVRKVDPFTGEIDENSPTQLVAVDDVTIDEEFEADGNVKVRNTYNLTGLLPLTTYVLNLKAVNEKGETEFTPAIVASSEDVVEDSRMMTPARVIFDAGKNTLDVEPKQPDDACTLLYVFVDGVWRTSHCHTASGPIPNIMSGKEYKVRFCTSDKSLKCSPLSVSVSAGNSASWKSNVTLPIFFFVFFTLSICVFTLVCCRSRSSTSKTSKLAPIILSPLSGDDETKKVTSYEEPNSSINYDSFQRVPTRAVPEYDLERNQHQLHIKEHETNNPPLQYLDNSDVHGDPTEDDDELRIVREIIV